MLQARRRKKSTFSIVCICEAWNYVKLNGKTTAIYRLADEGWKGKRGERNKTLINWTRKKKAKGIWGERFAPLIIITRETEKFLFLSFASWAARVSELLISLSPPFYTHWGNPWRSCLVRRPPLGSKQQRLDTRCLQIASASRSWFADENLMNFDGLFLALLSSRHCQRRGSQSLP